MRHDLGTSLSFNGGPYGTHEAYNNRQKMGGLHPELLAMLVLQGCAGTGKFYVENTAGPRNQKFSKCHAVAWKGRSIGWHEL